MSFVKACGAARHAIAEFGDWLARNATVSADDAPQAGPEFLSLLLALPWATHGMDYNFDGPGGQLSTYAIEHFLSAVLR